ncbi:MAG: endonuclease domain-containing protein [Bacteroidota bacterium]
MNIYYSLPMYYGASYKLFRLAQEMRLTPTAAESKLEEVLKSEPFKPFNFRRQHPIANYIADFYSHSLKLVIEADGGIHEDKEQKQYDTFRDSDMQQFKIKVLRFSNQQILEETQSVTEKIKSIILECELAAKKHGPL